jgi:ACS family hexuronate transporter-like MFS transporter
MAGLSGRPPIAGLRWWILGLLLAITVINFIDRMALSVAAPVLRDSFHLSNADYGTIVAAFQLGMMLGEFPMGVLMDRRGPRFGLSFAVLYWSVANALHAVARAGWQFGLFRFWLGSGECGNYSGGVKVVGQWFPPRERALAIGIFNGGSMLGSVIATPLLGAILIYGGWQAAFLLPGLLGFIWVAAWWTLYRAPGAHGRLSPAEARHIADGAEVTAMPAPTLATLLRLRQTWALMLCRFLVGPVVQFYVYWLPEYLYRQRGLSLRDIAAFAWIPFLFGDIGSIGGGWLAGRLIKGGMPVARARRATLLIGAGLCLASAGVALFPTAGLAMAAVCLVLFGHTFLSANMFASISDAFPDNAVARVTGLTGIAGGISGVLFPWIAGRLVDRVSYVPVFLTATAMPLLGVTALLMLSRPGRRAHA